MSNVESEWTEFTRAAAQVLSVNEELFGQALPALIEEPFSPESQAHLRELLGSERLARANEAAARLVGQSTIEGAA